MSKLSFAKGDSMYFLGGSHTRNNKKKANYVPGYYGGLVAFLGETMYDRKKSGTRRIRLRIKGSIVNKK